MDFVSFVLKPDNTWGIRSETVDQLKRKLVDVKPVMVKVEYLVKSTSAQTGSVQPIMSIYIISAYDRVFPGSFYSDIELRVFPF